MHTRRHTQDPFVMSVITAKKKKMSMDRGMRANVLSSLSGILINKADPYE